MKSALKHKESLLIPSLICLLMAIFAFKIFLTIKNTGYTPSVYIPTPTIIQKPTTTYPSPTQVVRPTQKPISAKEGCVIGGCNGEICADKNMASPCIYKPEFECYRNAVCERQADGACGWTQSAELTTCLGASI